MTLSPVNFGMTATGTSAPAGASARDGVSFGDRTENRSLLQGLMASRDQFTPSKDTAPQKVKNGSLGKGMGKAVKWGVATTALSFIAGLGMLVTAPFHLGLGVPAAIGLMLGAPLVGFMGSAIGFIKGKRG